MVATFLLGTIVFLFGKLVAVANVVVAFVLVANVVVAFVFVVNVVVAFVFAINVICCCCQCC